MATLPEPRWLDLAIAFDRTLAAFQNEAPITVDLALVAAFANGDIQTRGRCESWFEHDGIVEQLGRHVWLSEPCPDWEHNRFGVLSDGRRHIFTDVSVSRADLERWIAGNPADVTSARPAGAVANTSQNAAPHVERRKRKDVSDEVLRRYVTEYEKGMRPGERVKRDDFVRQCQVKIGCDRPMARKTYGYLADVRKFRRGSPGFGASAPKSGQPIRPAKSAKT